MEYWREGLAIAVLVVVTFVVGWQCAYYTLVHCNGCGEKLKVLRCTRGCSRSH